MKKLISATFGSPLLWGGILSIAFYAAIKRGIITNELVIRYTSGHPVEYITIILFFIGISSLAFKWLRLGQERRRLLLGTVFPQARNREPISRADEYLQTLDQARRVRGDSLYLQRLTAIISSLKYYGHAEEIEQEMRYLSEEDQIRAGTDYGMVRMFIWAIPILGFLGTVIGITMALGNLNLTELETSGKLLAAGLQVAFDTTALALSLVFVLYFSLFFVQGRENQLFATIDSMVNQEIRGRFFAAGSNSEQNQYHLIEQALQTITASFENLIQKQSAHWNESITAIREKTASIALGGSEQIETIISESLAQTMQSFVTVTREQQQLFLSESMVPIIRAIERKTDQMGAFKDQMTEQSRLLLEVSRATGEVTRLEDRLNHNLNALAKAGCFEETINNLAATIHLLNTKLMNLTSPWSEVRLSANNPAIVSLHTPPESEVG